MKVKSLGKHALLLSFSLIAIGCNAKAPIYKDATQPVEKRVEDLLSRMTIEEKTAQMTQKDYLNIKPDAKGNVSQESLEKVFGNLSIGTLANRPELSALQAAQASEAADRYIRENTRLGIPPMHIAEGLHGFLSLETTIFPQAIGLSSTWRPDLVKKMSAAIAKEASAAGVDQVLSPVFDVAKDPRWGRLEETYGEDPYLVGEMGVAYVNGVQGEPEVTATHIPEGKLMAMVKHFVAYSSPQGGINLGPTSLGLRELYETHIYPVKKAIQEANVYAVMPSYNEFDGIPMHTHVDLLRGVLRDELGFTGYTYSDWEALPMLGYAQKVAKDQNHAGELALKAGVDLEAPFPFGYKNIPEMVKSGQVDIKLVDEAVGRILTAKFKAGLFDRTYTVPNNLNDIVHNKEHIDLARTIAEESIILLKNEDNLLPLNKSKLKSIAVIGPNADRLQYGDYTATKSKKLSQGITLLDGIKAAVGDNVKVNYAEGVHNTRLDNSGIASAVEAANKSDVILLAIGGTHKVLGGVGWESDVSGGDVDDENIHPPTGGEGYDRTSLTPPGLQSELIKALHATGKPIVLVMIHGRPYSIVWENDNLPAIIEAWYPGEQGGNALADIIFGDVNPSGKLTVSVPRNVGQIPVFYNHKPTHRGFYKKPGTVDKPGRDYVFSTPAPLFEFGYGLSYTQFEYSDLVLNKTNYNLGDSHITVKVNVKNTGDRAGKEIVQLYFNDKISSIATPVKSLKGFDKIALKLGETKEVTFKLPIQELGLYNRDMKYVVEPGDFDIMVGASSDDIRLNKIINIAE